MSFHSRLALGATLFLALALPVSAKPAQAPASQSTPAVTVVRAAERELVERAIVTGTLVPREEILVAPEVEGYRIAEVLVEEGDTVKQGQVLARLTRDVLETQLAQNAASRARAEAGIAQARSNIVQSEAAHTEAQQALERARSLMRSGNTTEVVLEQRVSAARAAEGRLSAARDGLRIAEAERASTQAQQREIEWRLSRTEIRAPAAGVVARKNARVGATATAAGDPLFRIIANGEIELEGELTETQLPRLREGAEARVTVDGERFIEGRVRNVFPEVDRATRLGKVRISLQKDPALRIGSFARGTVGVARRTGVAVPIASVLHGAEGASVLAVVSDKVEARKVRTGLSAEGFVEISEGLKAGEAIVARAGSFLRDGDVVRSVESNQGGANRTAQSGETR
jgi:RND family efflux transporter MFP subunit